MENSGLSSFHMAQEQLASTLWPETLRLFPDLADRLKAIDTAAMLQRTLKAGVFDEYGLPTLEEVVDRHKIKVEHSYRGSTIHLTFPRIIVSDKLHAYVIGGDASVKPHELRLPKKCEVTVLVAIGDDLAVIYRDERYDGHFFWASDPAQRYDTVSYGYTYETTQAATVLEDGSVFLGQQPVRPGDKKVPQAHPYLHDGERFWRLSHDLDPASQDAGRSVRSTLKPANCSARVSRPGSKRPRAEQSNSTLQSSCQPRPARKIPR